MSTHKPLRMLSFDDKSLTTDLDRAGYKKMGVSVKSAASFDEGCKILAGDGADFIVINMDYTKLNAVQVIKHIKSTKDWKDIPVVATSVRSLVKLQQSALDAGAELFVEQPLPRQYFIEKVKGLLDQQTRSGNGRIELTSKATVHVGGKEHRFSIADLSASGLLLATELDLQPGTVLDIEFVIPEGKKPVSATCEVVRKVPVSKAHPDRPTGLGIRFTKFREDSKSRLERFVAKTANADVGLAYYL